MTREQRSTSGQYNPLLLLEIIVGLVFIALILIYCSDRREVCKVCTTITYIYGEPADSVRGVYCGNDLLRVDGRIIQSDHGKSLYYVTRCD